MEQKLIKILETYFGGNKSKMARELGISRTTLNSRIDSPLGASVSFYIAILEACEDLNSDWLFRDIGEMRASHSIEQGQALKDIYIELKTIKKAVM